MADKPQDNPPLDNVVETDRDSEDELDKDQIQQLHGMLLQVANNCFEVKKLCATALVATATLIATFGNRQLRPAIFPVALVVVVLFWITDAQSYYYQEKIRARMKQLQQRRVDRAGLTYRVDGVGMQFVARPTRITKLLRAMVNESMLYYVVLAVIDGVLWVAAGPALR
jgi:hypothetical protein